ncbi:hypothetical protein [Amycolatopsis sp. NPDC058986]|uniref:hypothetical protein n=1 Tax=unclassified Amycolatopsis TaxID=2618356 RepID=UPI00366AF461
MFEYVRPGTDPRDERRALRVVDPPKRVRIHPGLWLPHGGISRGRDTPFWVRASGISQSREVTGILYAWVLTSTGRWCALVALDEPLSSGNGRLSIPLDRQLVPAGAVLPVTGPGSRRYW